MKSKEPITAEEFIKNRFIYEPKIFSQQEACDLMHEYAVLFAKHHRERMLEAIDNKINEFYRTGSGNWPSKVDIENAYTESEIK